MTKIEIETAILKEFALFFPKIKYLKFDKALPLLQEEVWRLADKYDSDGPNVMNIIISRYKEMGDGEC